MELEIKSTRSRLVIETEVYLREKSALLRVLDAAREIVSRME